MKNKIALAIFLSFFCAIFPVFSKETGKEPVTLTVTAYAYCYHSRTSSGTMANTGTVAVDPRIIPIGTKLYIPGYGWGKALDKGSAIKGNKIDIWFPSVRECLNWGIRKVKIKIY